MKQLSKEQEVALEQHRKEYLKILFDCKNFDVGANILKEVNQDLYAQCGLKKPTVIVVDSPFACREEFKRLGAGDTPNFSMFGNASDLYWLAYYDFYAKHVDTDYVNKDIDVLKEVTKWTFSSIQLEDYCIVSRMPVSLSVQEDMTLHNLDGKSVEFPDGYGQYYVHGRYVEKGIYEALTDPKAARHQFDSTQNEDIRGIISTVVQHRWGNEGLMDMLDAEVVDTMDIVHANGYVETQKLIKTKDVYSWARDSKGNRDVPLAWQQMTCPSTKTTYLIPTCPSFDTVLDSAKFTRPSQVPTEMPYTWQSAN